MPPQQAIPPTDDPPRMLLSGIASYVVNLFVRFVISTESEGQVEVESAVPVTLQFPPGGDSGAARAPQVRHDPNITGNPPGPQAELREAGLSRRPYEAAYPEFTPDTWSEADVDDPPPMDVVPAQGQPKRVSYLNTTFAETSGWPTDIGGHPLPTPPATPAKQVPAPGDESPPSPSAAARAPARRAVERTDPGGLPLPILEPPRTPAKKAKAQDVRASTSPSPGPSSPARPALEHPGGLPLPTLELPRTSAKKTIEAQDVRAATSPRPGPSSPAHAPASGTLEHPGRLPPPTLELPRTPVKKQGKARDVRVAVSLCPGSSPSPRTHLHCKPTPSPGPSSPAPSSPVSKPRKKSRYSDAVPPPRSPAGPLALALHEEGPAETPVEDPSLAVLEMLFSWQRKDLERILRRERDALQAEREHAWVGTLVKWDTGMGKTILTIALICVTLSELNMPTLILCPNVGMMTQWHEEIKKFAPHLKAAFYHASYTSGHLEKRAPEALESYDVVLSTYHQVNEQARAKETSKIKKEQCDPRSCPFLLLQWGRVVADESHIFRSPTGKFAAACLALPKRVGLLLSATPMQNYPCDLYAQLHFLGRDYGELQKARELTYRFAERRYLPKNVYNTAGTPLVVSDLGPSCVCCASDDGGGPCFQGHPP
ncbi:hypothetical protein PHLGIDRAFT_446608 [Phlebiopsis gigantea 11061_1 CR5-6]|uniref:Helicase ATP-binding domain-containing protein n=1 Tax=Phlebiopsis gigantea (strain 11061_1 CR5-6) TaxID=745531 RepID=A0A0C3NNP3_PHLG1|nr:hypothetical protein PHLGIDRAFT_446608 [Phlebiopsis gigantea 11061_1 CR5-6]